MIHLAAPTTSVPPAVPSCPPGIAPEWRVPIVVNRKRRPPGCDPVYVGRPTCWGNPYRIGLCYVEGTPATREDVIARYRDWLRANPDLMARARRELRGRDLECWCAPEACHADVLLAVANGEGEV